MGIYIPGMEMPTNADMAPTAVWVYPNGSVVVFKGNGNMRQHTEAVPVPPHGRLIDADAIRADIDKERPGRSYEDAWALTVLDNAPTILEAEEGET